MFEVLELTQVREAQRWRTIGAEWRSARCVAAYDPRPRRSALEGQGRVVVCVHRSILTAWRTPAGHEGPLTASEPRTIAPDHER